MSLFDRFLKKSEPSHVKLTLRDGREVDATLVPRALALEEWQRRRATAKGWVPLMIGAEVPDSEPEETDPAAILKRAAAVNLERALHDRLKDAGLEGDPGLDYDFSPTALVPQRPREPNFHAFAEDPVWIAEIPCEAAWQVPAWVAFGAWNECPSDDLHCALLHEWQKTYGAELIAMTPSTLELWLPKPIEDRDLAKKIAQQQVAYCEDIVTQGTGTVKKLAQELIGSPHWFFWWD